MLCPNNSLGYCFIIKGKVGGCGQGGEWPSLSFLSRRHVSIISSSPGSDRDVYLSLYDQARTVHIALWKNIFRFQYNEGFLF